MKMPTIEELGQKIGEYALDEFVFKGKTLREWAILIISKDVISKRDIIEFYETQFPNLDDDIHWSRRDIIENLDCIEVIDF